MRSFHLLRMIVITKFNAIKLENFSVEQMLLMLNQ